MTVALKAVTPLSGDFSLADFLDMPPSPAPSLVQGILGESSVNLLIGDSGLGKTALGVQLGMCVAGGIPFLGRPTTQGTVLYIDAESAQDGFRSILKAQTQFLGVAKQTPFFTYSQLWDIRENASRFWLELIKEHIEKRKPKLVIIDPLRAVFPLAETKTDEAQGMVKSLRALTKQFGCSFLITHHVRKVNREYEIPDLLDDPHGWLQEAAGSRALMTGVDTRIGVDKSDRENVALVLGGYQRLTGKLPTMFLGRQLDENLIAEGYVLAASEHSLSPKQLDIYASLPTQFRVSSLTEKFKSTKMLYKFLESAVGAGLLIQDPLSKIYQKASNGVLDLD